MMVEDLGVEAREAAVREVAKLLPVPELLQSISSIKADYISRQQVNLFCFALNFCLCICNSGIGMQFVRGDVKLGVS